MHESDERMISGRDQFQRLESVFEQACALPARERAGFVARECRGDDDLEAQVLALLGHDAELPMTAIDDGIARGIAMEAAAVTGATTDTTAQPSRIGPYRIVDRLGTGGMGVVYRAEQENPRRTVALKMIRPGLMSERALRRFEFEAQVLGLLQHPGIASIYEAGTANAADTGEPVPFFAMELVEGQPIDSYVHAQRLSVRDRLELVARVCDAVHHAHQKGVIHRDLKPANILVTRDGGDVQPKVLDFGVARAADAEPGTTTYYTADGQLIGTLPYMSPEQVQGSTAVIDTRSDVYSLGVVIFEVLCGQLPIDIGTRPIVEAAAMIAGQTPQRLSSSDLRFRGDIETIVQKCLEKEPDRRYGSAAEIAADLRRHLRNEPIAARPASRVYQLRKFVRRNRALVAAVAAVFVVLVVYNIRETQQRVREREQRQLAEQQTAEANKARLEAEAALDGSERVTRFLATLLTSANPGSADGKDVTVRMKLKEAEAQVDDEFAGQPLIQARLRNAIGETYLGLGEYRAAQEQFRKSSSIEGEGLGARHAATIRAQLGLASATLELSEFDEALAVAESAFRMSEEYYGTRNSETISALGVLAAAHDKLNKNDEALRLMRQHVELSASVLGPEHVSTTTARGNLAMHLQRVGQAEEAEELFRAVLELRKRQKGDDHPDTLLSLNNLGYHLRQQKRFADAIPYFEAAVDGANRILGPNHAKTMAYGNNLGVCYYAEKHYEEARPFFERAVAVGKEKLGPQHPQTLLARGNLAGLWRKAGQLDLALEAYPDILAGYRKAFPPGHPHIGMMLRLHGLCFLDAKEFESAEEALLEAEGIIRKALGPKHPASNSARESVVQLYEAWEQPEKAAEWRQSPEPKENNPNRAQ